MNWGRFWQYTLDICHQGKFIWMEVMELLANFRDDWNGRDSEKRKQLLHRSDFYVLTYVHSRRTRGNIQVAPRKISATCKEKLFPPMRVVQ